MFIAAADCTGHGVPGAMVSFVCSNALTKSVLEDHISDPGKILDNSRNIVIDRFSKNDQSLKDGMDISLCSFDPQSQLLKWSGANNPIIIFRKDAVSYEEIKGDKQPVGKYSNMKPFTTHETQLEKGDRVYMYSDGYVDQFGGDKGKKLKSKNFKKLLEDIQKYPMNEQQEHLDTFYENWTQNFEQIDDICVIGFEI